MKKIGKSTRPIAFGEPGAKQSQDDKPCRVMAKPVPDCFGRHSLWSHLSLHSRCGSRLTATQPLLSRLNPARSIPARPFGLGLRFDGALLVARTGLLRSLAARSIKPTPRGEARVTIKSAPVKRHTGGNHG